MHRARILFYMCNKHNEIICSTTSAHALKEVKSHPKKSHAHQGLIPTQHQRPLFYPSSLVFLQIILPAFQTMMLHSTTLLANMKNIVTRYYVEKMELWMALFVPPFYGAVCMNSNNEFTPSRGAIHFHMLTPQAFVWSMLS